MSLFDEASLIVTPNAFKASKLYSIKPTDGSGDLSVVRATTATRVNSAGLIETVSANVPRLDYTNSTCPSILVEPQRTNLLTFSDGLLTNYQTRGGNIIQALNPINSFVNSVQFLNNSVDSYLYKNFIITNSIQYNMSIFIQMDDNSTPNVGSTTTTGDFSFNVMGALSSTTEVIKIKNTNVYRISANRIATTTGNAAFGVVKYTRQSTKGFKVTGYQLEVGANATSYIPTVASAVTRNADVISKTGISDLIGQTEGTMFCELNLNNFLGNVNRRILCISNNNSASENIQITFTSALTNTIRAVVATGGSFPLITSSQITNLGKIKIAVAYSTTDVVLYINGVKQGTDLGSVAKPVLNSIQLGNLNNADYLNDSINSATIWKTRLDNATLATLTTI